MHLYVQVWEGACWEVVETSFRTFGFPASVKRSWSTFPPRTSLPDEEVARSRSSRRDAPVRYPVAYERDALLQVRSALVQGDSLGVAENKLREKIPGCVVLRLGEICQKKAWPRPRKTPEAPPEAPPGLAPPGFQVPAGEVSEVSHKDGQIAENNIGAGQVEQGEQHDGVLKDEEEDNAGHDQRKAGKRSDRSAQRKRKFYQNLPSSPNASD